MSSGDFSTLLSTASDDGAYYLNETRFSIANGYVGVRAFFEEDKDRFPESIRGCYINGFHDTHPIHYEEKHYGYPELGETIVNIVDSQSFVLSIDGKRLNASGWKLSRSRQQLHLSSGIYERTAEYESETGQRLRMNIRKFASLTDKNVVAGRITVTALNFSGELGIRHSIDADVENFHSIGDPRVKSYGFKPLVPCTNEVHGGVPFVSAKTKNTGHTVSAALILSPGDYNYEKTDSGCALTSKALLREREHHSVDRLHLYCDSRRMEDMAAVIETYRGASFDELAERNRAELSRFWDDCDIEIEGDEKLQLGVRYNIFQLLQSASVDHFGSIAAKGLSGEGYEGHYFWDAEIYMLPMFLFNSPKRAKNLLEYRFHALEAARRRARVLRHKKGAAYPWRTIADHECSAFYPTGTAQYHINADIAYAFVQYYKINTDEDFLKKYMVELLVETSRIWMDMGFFQDGVFHINQVTGPNEYNTVVNDNYYTNAMARFNLLAAVEAAGTLREIDRERYEELKRKLDLTETELEGFADAAEAMCLLYDENWGINPQDSGFLLKERWDFENTPKDHYPLLLHYHPLMLGRYQLCKQADTVLTYVLLDDIESEEVIRRSFEYYEGITTHDSSLSASVFGILAGRLGLRDKSYDYFLKTVFLDLDNTHGNTKDGLHLANLGGTWMGIVYGFAGVRWHDDHLKVSPFLPRPLNRIQFSLLTGQSRIHFDIRQDGTRMRLMEGPPVKILHLQNLHELKTFLHLKDET